MKTEFALFVMFTVIASLVIADIPAGQQADIPAGQQADIPAGQQADIPASQQADIPAGQQADIPVGNNVDTQGGNVDNGRQRWVGESMCRPTSADVLGPYYFPNPPPRPLLCNHDPEFTNVPALLVVGKIRGENCAPLPGAKIEIWQADHGGHYIMRKNCRGFIQSRQDGRYHFFTIHPGKYTVDGEYRPAHIHFRTEKEGYNILVTQMYFAGDSNLGRNDSCTACQSDKPDLVVQSHTVCPPDNASAHCFDMVHFDMTLKQGASADVVPDVDDQEAELFDKVFEGK